MELAGAIDSQCIGMDVGELTGMDEALEIPVLNDLTMVLCSIAQTRATGVVVDFSEPSSVYDNVKQAAAFGLSSVVYVPKIEMDTITELSAFCDKASMDLPSPDAIQIANNISDLGQIYNRQDMDSDNRVYTLKHDVTDVQSLMRGLILAIRKVIRLKNLIYGLEKFL
ncbi:Dihydrodipicolinate reductase, C-terminus family protein [Hordeum vulgare]|nr:Dihydrodipicolinate reductase, C-terminus family protein [Hordeum vulgare]